MAVIDSVKLPDNSTYEVADNHSGYQKETLTTPLTINGTQKTTVEGALGGLNDYADKIEGSMSNENLLDNGWFMANQRGFASHTMDTTYFPTVDRWIGVAGSYGGIITLGASGINFNKEGYSSQFYFTQKMKGLAVGKVYTLSVLFSDGIIEHGTGIINSTSDSVEFEFSGLRGKARTYYYATWSQWLTDIITYAGANYTIRAIKLELGSISTLANDVAPDYALELAKCQTSTADPSDTYANQGQLMTSALQGVYGAVNILDLLTWLTARSVGYYVVNDTTTNVSLASTSITNPYVIADSDKAFTLSAKAITNSGDENFRIELLNSSNTVVATLDSTHLKATGVGCKIKGDLSNYGTVTLQEIMITDARVSMPAYAPYAKTNQQLTQNKAERNDLSTIHATGSTNTTGSTITKGTLFYLNGQLCKALQDIGAGNAFTLNTNYKEDTVANELTTVEAWSIAPENYAYLTEVFEFYRVGKVVYFKGRNLSYTLPVGSSTIIASLPAELIPVRTWNMRGMLDPLNPSDHFAINISSSGSVEVYRYTANSANTVGAFSQSGSYIANN